MTTAQTIELNGLRYDELKELRDLVDEWIRRRSNEGSNGHGDLARGHSGKGC